MIINGVLFNCELADVLQELRAQLVLNHIQLLEKTRDIGKDIQVQCPYHNNGQERRPSAGIRKSDGKFHCFACGETHELTEVISHCFGKVDDVFGQFGWKWLCRNFATISVEERKPLELDWSRDTTKSVKKYVSEEELDKYRYYHEYWTTRGIVDDDIIELFDLGYDKEQDAITFPVRDENGNCLFIARRNTKFKRFNYPKDAEKPLYGLYELQTYKSILSDEKCRKIDSGGSQAIICESMIDCILLWQAGYVALALNGVGSEAQYRQLQQLPVRKLVLATDNDKAGDRARAELRWRVRNKLITEIFFPEDIKDVGECTPAQIDHLLDWEIF